MDGIYILLGTNLGDRPANLATARAHLLERVGALLQTSSIYQTAAWGITQQPDFLNQVVQVSTTMEPEAVLRTLLAIEQDMGRVRHIKWGERLIDLDLLYYHSRVLHTEALTVPHPGIPDRRFTLIPLAELAADQAHPTLGLTQRELLAQCPDDSEVSPWHG